MTDVKPAAEALRAHVKAVYSVGINSQDPLNFEELEMIAGDRSRVYTDATLNEFLSVLDQLTVAANCRRAQ